MENEEKLYVALFFLYSEREFNRERKARSENQTQPIRTENTQ
jgi:hypothetical protein